MFHVGKVIKVFRNGEKEIIGTDSSVQAMVMMWDENLITVAVKESLGDKIKENDIALIDYSPTSPNIPVPRQLIIKILRGETGKKAWKEYEDFKNSKKRTREAQQYAEHQFTNVG
ncbi:MAG: hypothetical protein PHH08_02800 [Candidatus ainarchaeum sp.]|nr:hypothetical protein [Candidatus ainarchaeum sp.]